MVDLKSITHGAQRYIGVTLKLPFVPLYLVLNTKGFLCGPIFEIHAFDSVKTCVCIMSQAESYEQLLESVVVRCSSGAIHAGILLGMSGYEAMSKMNETKD